jgi:hypothetical protein
MERQPAGGCDDQSRTPPGRPTRQGRPPVVIVVVAVVAILALVVVWTSRSRPQPVPAPSPSPSTGPPSAWVSPTPTPYPLADGPIVIQTAVPGLLLFSNGVFELYRGDSLLDSGKFYSSVPLDFYFEGTRGKIVLEGDHLVRRPPMVYANWTWQRGTGDYAGLTGSGTVDIIVPKRNRYGNLGRFSGTVHSASSASPSPSRR